MIQRKCNGCILSVVFGILAIVSVQMAVAGDEPQGRGSLEEPLLRVSKSTAPNSLGHPLDPAQARRQRHKGSGGRLRATTLRLRRRRVIDHEAHRLRSAQKAPRHAPIISQWKEDSMPSAGKGRKPPRAGLTPDRSRDYNGRGHE